MTDSNAALLPCPFCGGEPEIGHYKTFDNDEWWIGCDCECGPCTKVSLTKEKAIEAWNMRHERICHAESDLSEWVCSECQCWIPLGLTSENIKHASEWRYCPHCGAKVKAVKR